MTKLPLLFLVAFFVTFHAFANNNEWKGVNFDDFHGMGKQLYYRNIKRSDNNKSYHLYVRLPQVPAEQSKQYPIVYLLDGGIAFPMLTPHYQLLNALKELPDVILVGISYGTDDWQQGNNRAVDFTAPSNKRSHWGGAKAFSEFLQQQLFPVVESNFPADPKRRIMFGNSLAGQFGLYSALHNPGMFYGIIASNPAIHTNTEFFLKPVANLANVKARLFIASAEKDAPRFKQPLQQWLKHWSSQTDVPWELKLREMTDHSHVSSIPDAFYHGMKWLLPKAENSQ